MPESASLLKFVCAFAFVLALMFLLAWVLKRLGLAGQTMLPGGKRRLKIVEHLPVDHRRRLVLVRRDDREHLLLLSPSGETVVESNIPARADSVVALEPGVEDIAAQKEQKHA